jgi:hypothetical protein
LKGHINIMLSTKKAKGLSLALAAIALVGAAVSGGV